MRKLNGLLALILLNSISTRAVIVDQTYSHGNGSFEYAEGCVELTGDYTTPGLWFTGSSGLGSANNYGMQITRARNNAGVAEGSHALVIGGGGGLTNDVSGGVLNTGYIVQAGDVFSLSYAFAPLAGWGSQEGLDVILFTSDDNTINGTKTLLWSLLDQHGYAGDLTYYRNETSTVDIGSVHVGRELFIEFSGTTDAIGGIDGFDGYARVDDVKLFAVQNALAGEFYPASSPDDGFDDAQAIRDAVAAAASGGGGTIVLGNGTWTLSSFVGDVNQGYSAVSLDNISNLRIRGSGETVLEVTDYTKRAFRVADSDNITIEDLKVTYSVPPIASGEILSWTGSGESRIYTVQKVTASSDFDADIFSNSLLVNAFFSKEMSPTRMVPNTYQVYNPVLIENLGSGQFRLQLDQQSDVVSVGDFINLLPSYSGSGVARTLRSENITYSNVDFSNIPGLAWTGLYNKWVIFDGCDSVFPSDIYITATRDIIHLGNSVGTIISNCYLSGSGDTLVNLKMVLSPAEKESDTVIKTDLSFYGEVGDYIHIIRPSTGGSVVGRMIQGISVSGTNTYITVNAFTVNINSGDLILNEDKCHNYASVTGNVFEESRRQGLLIRAFDALISDNVFKGLGGPGVQSIYQYSYNEGGRLARSIIMGNIFDDVELSYDSNNSYRGAVDLLWGTSEAFIADSVYEGHRQIWIVDNTFRNYHDAAVRINGGYNIVIQSNVVFATTTFLRSTNNMFYISNSSLVDIINNDGTGDLRYHTSYINLDNVSDAVTTPNTF